MREWLRESELSPRNNFIGAMALGAAVGFGSGEAQLVFDNDVLHGHLHVSGLEAGLVGAVILAAYAGIVQHRQSSHGDR